MMLLCLMVVLIASCEHAQSSGGDSELRRLVVPLFEVPHEGISEMSGLTRSHNYPDVYWVHNDSGDSPRLFSMGGEGNLIWPPFVNESSWEGLSVVHAANIDWEDITSDGEYLYVAETGNNGNARRDLGIYVIPEPNPRASTVIRPLRYLPVAYPEQTTFPGRRWHYDSEAMFTVGGEIFFITKHRVAGKIDEFEDGANLYRLTTRNTDEVNALELIESQEDLAIVTGADVSPDGQYLAVLCYDALWVFAAPPDNRQWFSTPVGTITLDRDYTKQVEAITWADNDTMLVGNEQGTVFSVTRKTLPRP
ncbi:MAG: hypothetical protein AAF525_12215 [Pseudomonadota bacterium]